MSLVERALKKLQESRPNVPPSGTSTPLPKSAAARVVDTPAAVAPVLGAESVHVQRPRRTVEIDRNALRNMDLLAPVSLERRIAAQYQQIKRALVPRALGKSEEKIPNGHLVMLASALPGEGKTFTSINLALSMALEKDINVVLVDADVAKPHVTRVFGIENEPGLLDLLGDTSLHAASVVLPTNVPRLNLLPAGRQCDAATELLASARMGEILLQISRYFGPCIVLFDSPPLLLSTESRALLEAVGQVVLVVRADVTPQQAVMDAIETVGDSKPTSLILNQSAAAAGASYYAYGYGVQDEVRAET